MSPDVPCRLFMFVSLCQNSWLHTHGPPPLAAGAWQWRCSNWSTFEHSHGQFGCWQYRGGFQGWVNWQITKSEYLLLCLHLWLVFDFGNLSTCISIINLTFCVLKTYKSFYVVHKLAQKCRLKAGQPDELALKDEYMDVSGDSPEDGGDGDNEVLVRHYGLWINENTDPKSQLLWVLYHDCYLLVIVYLRYRSTTFQYNLP